MRIETVKSGGILYLGKQGEHLAQRLRFPVAAWQERYGAGTFQLLHQREGDEAPYPVSVAADGKFVTWDVTAADTAVPGTGRCELQYRVGEALAKSQTWVTRVTAALGAPGDVPEPQQSWVDEVLAAGAAAESAAGRAEAAALRQPVIGENGNWWLWDAEAGAYADSGRPSAGDSLPEGGAEGQYLVRTAGGAGWADLPVYGGAYEVTPLAGAETTMATERSYLDRDIVVRAVPVYKTENQGGGYTVVIGG